MKDLAMLIQSLQPFSWQLVVVILVLALQADIRRRIMRGPRAVPLTDGSIAGDAMQGTARDLQRVQLASLASRAADATVRWRVVSAPNAAGALPPPATQEGTLGNGSRKEDLETLIRVILNKAVTSPRAAALRLTFELEALLARLLVAHGSSVGSAPLPLGSAVSRLEELQLVETPWLTLFREYTTAYDAALAGMLADDDVLSLLQAGINLLRLAHGQMEAAEALQVPEHMTADAALYNDNGLATPAD
jgi:hypothetical protein